MQLPGLGGEPVIIVRRGHHEVSAQVGEVGEMGEFPIPPPVQVQCQYDTTEVLPASPPPYCAREDVDQGVWMTSSRQQLQISSANDSDS